MEVAYYRLSQIIKMRREALGNSRYAYDVEGPSAMTVYRIEEKNVRASEKTYRKLTKAMGEEESTRRGVLKTKNIEVLWLTNEIADSFFDEDCEKTELLIEKLEVMLDCNVKRNQQYLDFVKIKLQYKKGLLEKKEYEKCIKEGYRYADLDFDKMLEHKWPYCEREWNRLVSIIEVIRSKKAYEEQKKLLWQMYEIIQMPYMEQEYTVAYMVYIRWRMGDALGNLGLYREAIKLSEETLRLCEEKEEYRYLVEIYYDVFWSYQEIKKKETLTVQEESRCKECLIKAYYVNKALFPENKLYEQKVRAYYPNVLKKINDYE